MDFDSIPEQAAIGDVVRIFGEKEIGANLGRRSSTLTW
jgi:hypothetical protein